MRPHGNMDEALLALKMEGGHQTDVGGLPEAGKGKETDSS